RMTQYRSNRPQGNALAEHLGGGRMTKHMGAMPRCFDTRPLDRLGRNLADGLVRQALDGCRGGEKNSVVVHEGTIIEIVQDGVTDFLGEWEAVLTAAFATDCHRPLLPVEVSQL